MTRVIYMGWRLSTSELGLGISIDRAHTWYWVNVANSRRLSTTWQSCNVFKHTKSIPIVLMTDTYRKCSCKITNSKD